MESKNIFIEIGALVVGGVETFSIDLANFLQSQGHSVTLVVILPGNTLKHTVHPNVKILNLFGNMWIKSLKLAYHLKKDRVSVYFTFLHRLRAVAILMGVKKNIHIFHSTFHYSLKTLLLEPLIKKRTTYVGVSQHVIDAARKDLKLNDVIIQKIYHGLDLNLFPNKTKHLGNKIKICALGRLSIDKRFDRFIDLANTIPKDYLDRVEFHLVGHGDQIKELHDYRNKTLPRKFPFFFHGETLNVPDVLSNFHVLIATPDRIGFDIVLIEAMAMKLAVIAYDIGPIREVIGNDGAGIIVSSNDIATLKKELITLINNKELIHDLGEKGRTRVEKHFRKKNTLLKYSQLIE